MYVAFDASLYNACPLLQDLHPPLEGIQLMSIAGYEAFVCVCFFVYKTLCAALHMASVGCPYVPVCVLILREIFLHTKKYRNKNEKHFFK